jgi:hypothetical protein
MSKSKSMSLSDKIDLTKSVVRLADFWGLEPSDLLSWVSAICKKAKVSEWNKIAKEVEAFGEASFEERAKMLGVKLMKND